MKILIVDDSRTARMLIKGSIPGNLEARIEEAENGKEGLEKFRSFLPDVTFLDLTMPVMDGFSFLSVLHEEYPKAVVIVLSADIQRHSLSRVKELGALRFLKKPPELSEIHEALRAAQQILGGVR